MIDDILYDNTPVWRIYKEDGGKHAPVLSAWYTGYPEEGFLVDREFGTEVEAQEWLEEFWQAYWRLIV